MYSILIDLYTYIYIYIWIKSGGIKPGCITIATRYYSYRVGNYGHPNYSDYESYNEENNRIKLIEIFKNYQLIIIRATVIYSTSCNK